MMGSKNVSGIVMRLAKQQKYSPLILDGGMGTSLHNLGLNEHDAWSAPRRMREKYIRESVKRVHSDFLESGVDILTTNTYDSEFQVEESGPDENFKKSQWIFDNIEVANEAIDEFVATKDPDFPRPLLAMSVGSYATVFLGRAETANREQSDESDCRRCEGYGHKESDIDRYFNARLTDDILHHAAQHGVAVLAIETVGDLLEVKVICDVLKTKSAVLSETGLCTWVTLTCLTENTVDTGGNVTDCVQELARCKQVTGVGINCTEPHLVTPIVTKIKQVLQDCDAADKFIVVYPNSGETYLSRELKEGETDHWKKQSMYENWNYADAAMEWVNLGVDIIGGCCRITAKDIAQLAKKLKKL